MKRSPNKFVSNFIELTPFSAQNSTKAIEILRNRVDCTNYGEATNQILGWALTEKKKYICVANVHMVMEAYRDYGFQEIVNKAGLVTPDGMPLVWTMRILGAKNQTRVYGPTLTLHVCKYASMKGLPVGFYGGGPETIKSLVQNISSQFPNLRIAYASSPPFRSISEREDEKVIQSINNSGAKILFVGLGCPKQENWMFNHQGKINAVMIGVGAAFDFHAGTKKQAPAWMMKMGFEWLFRLMLEPKRLWRRYLFNNPLFLYLVAKQLVKERLRRTLIK